MSLIIPSSLLNTKSSSDGVFVPLPRVGSTTCQPKTVSKVSRKSYCASPGSSGAFRLCPSMLGTLKSPKTI